MPKNYFTSTIKDDLLKHRILKEGINPCGSCPFHSNPYYFDCWACAELFPGWAMNWLDEKGQRCVTKEKDVCCPCFVLDKDFVIWRIALYLEKGI